MLEPSAAADQAAGQVVANAGPQNDWAEQFSNMRLDNGTQPGGWADEFAQVTAFGSSGLLSAIHVALQSVETEDKHERRQGICCSTQ